MAFIKGTSGNCTGRIPGIPNKATAVARETIATVLAGANAKKLAAELHSSKVSFVCESTSYVGANGQMYEMYNMDRETTICLLTGYDAVARITGIQIVDYTE